MIPLSLYIHTPWCVRKCPYCDFNSHALREEAPEPAYLKALLDDFATQTDWIQARALQSIFIGGGTPSLLSAEFYAQLLETLRQRIEFTDDIEITLEANPGTVEQARVQGYREAGINRLSLGIQSFQPEQLQKLGRIHNRDEALQAVDIARASGFDNVNLDLMFGLPEQTLAEALADLDTALEVKPPHFSWYQLTLEPNTYFHRYPPDLPDDDSIWLIQTQGLQRLQEHGYEHYEVSAYAQPQHQCRHNLNYWQFGDYLGIGAGAHAKLTDLNSHTVIRRWNTKHPRDYLNTYSYNQSTLDTKALTFEFMLNALRLQQPIAIELFQQRTGLEFNTLQDGLARAHEMQLLHVNTRTFMPTELGRRFLNDLCELFL